MSRTCQLCRTEPPAPAVFAAVASGIELCTSCARWLPGTEPLEQPTDPPPWPAEAKARLPIGAEPVAGGWFHETPVARAEEDGRLFAYKQGQWWGLAPVLEATDTGLTIGCPSCRPDRRRRRKPRTLSDRYVTHLHGRPPGEDGPVIDRAPHHDGPGYLILDVYGVLERIPGRPRT